MLRDHQYQEALERVEVLLKIVVNDADLTSRKFIELSKLSDAIADYEEQHFPFE